MNAPLPAFALPDDSDLITAVLRRQGGLAQCGPDLLPQISRAIGGLDLSAVVTLAESASGSDATTIYRLWLDVHGTQPASGGAWYNMGVALLRTGQPAAAAAAMDAALRFSPGLWQAALARGMALEAAGEPGAAEAAWRVALLPAEGRRQLHVQLARILEDQGRLGPALEEARAALLIDPAQPDVIQHLVHNRQRTAAWPPLDLCVPGIDRHKATLAAGPLAALALFDDPGMQAEVAADWVRRKVAPVPGPLAPPRGYAHDRIRVGYLSSDFCRHAMSYLIAEVLERHDRSRFEIWGYCASPEDGSDIRARVVAAFDHYVPVRALTDEAAAAQIRADEIDILIDLNGLTKGARPGIVQRRPAPVQATYLGYIGPVPLSGLDWLICDDQTIPPEEEAQYQPRPLRIEGCYQANDGREFDLPAVSRAEEGLPRDAFVFTCVSHHYKITEEVFAVWCRIVASVPGSVLWLIDDNPESRSALTVRWIQAGLAPSRLLFAPRTDPARYRARLALADLFLDTTPYNAGTIASDALRMGLPLLTLRGRAFSARMGASLLTAVGLPACIADDLADYEGRAIAIGTDAARLAALKAHLAAGAWARTLGDSVGFTQRLEAALTRVCLRP